MFKLGLYREIRYINLLLQSLIALLDKDIKVLRERNDDTDRSNSVIDSMAYFPSYNDRIGRQSKLRRVRV